MKRLLLLVLACVMTLSLASMAAAATPEPVTRMGDWVEVGNDVFMNLIAVNTIRYQVSENYDFEGDRRDVARGSRPVNSSTNRNGGNDVFYAEVRFGVDFRYKKDTKMRVLFETESIFDGNLIDDTQSTAGDELSPHVERFWVEHTFAGTPIRARIGAWLWCWDTACTVADDDPGTAIFVDLGPVELKAMAVIQTESFRQGLTNDNDEVRYQFGIVYNAKPHRIALDFMYNRDRFNNVAGGQESDTFLIMPGYKGKFGPVQVMAEFLLNAGEVRSNVQDYDVLSYAFLGEISVDLGMVRPRLGFIYASGDDDVTDDELNGFFPYTDNDVSLISMSGFPTFDGNVYSNNAPCAMNSAICGGATGPRTITSPFNDRIGNTAHPGVDVSLSNPGTISLVAGVEITPVKQHKFAIWYSYMGVEDSEVMEAVAGGADIGTTLMHDIGASWAWNINKHLQLYVRGNLGIPGDAQQDIAELHFTCGDTGAEQCEGEDLALLGEVQVRGAF